MRRHAHRPQLIDSILNLANTFRGTGRIIFPQTEMSMHPATSPKSIVSICLPVYNGEAFLRLTIESALSQTFRDFELIIVDDCSTDSSTEIIREYAAGDKRIIWSQNERRLGLFEAYNESMKRARGHYIKPFAQDDLWSPELLAEQVALLDNHPKVALVTTRRVLIDESGKTQPALAPGITDSMEERQIYPAKVVIEAALRCRLNNLIGEPCAVMFRKSSLGAGFNTTFKHLGDLEYWLRILADGDLALVNKPLTKFRAHPKSATARNLARLSAYTDIIHLARECKSLLNEMGTTEEEFIRDNLAVVGAQLPRNSEGAVDLAALAGHDDFTHCEIDALKNGFLYAVSMIKSEQSPFQIPLDSKPIRGFSNIVFGQALRLVHINMWRQDRSLIIALCWRNDQQIDLPRNVGIHILNPSREIIGQADYGLALNQPTRAIEWRDFVAIHDYQLQGAKEIGIVVYNDPQQTFHVKGGGRRDWANHRLLVPYSERDFGPQKIAK